MNWNLLVTTLAFCGGKDTVGTIMMPMGCSFHFSQIIQENARDAGLVPLVQGQDGGAAPERHSLRDVRRGTDGRL